MSRENVELVRQVYNACNRDDFQWVLDHTAPEIEFRPNPGLADLDRVYRGREGVEASYVRWRDAWDTLSFRVERVEDLGDRVLALVVVSGQGRGSRVEVRHRRAHLFDFETGRFVRFESFATWDDALDAAGLSDAGTE